MQRQMDITAFKTDVDEWIKHINSKIAKFHELPEKIEDNSSNIQHNYELVFELKDELDELKSEIKELKLIHLIALKSQLLKEKAI